MEKRIKKLEGKNHEKQPLVSVIMPVYNAEKYVGEAIESVLSQTYPYFELLLINDASSDDSGSICKEYKKKDNRIVLLENLSKDHGPGPTRNIGLDYAKGKFIYFMDADDWVEKDLLEAAVKRLQETGADLVQFGLIQEHGDGKTSAYCWEGKDVLTKEEIESIKEMMERRMKDGFITVIASKKALENSGLDLEIRPLPFAVHS